MATSDAVIATQSVKPKRCEYRHVWSRTLPGADMYYCTRCDFHPKRESKAFNEAVSTIRLLEKLKQGDTIYTILRHVSRSGMNRRISLLVGDGKAVTDISWDAAQAMGDPVKNRAGYVQDVGIEVSGCGMDMGFHLVYNLGRYLYPDGFECSGESCPSNDHFNDPKCKRSTFKGKMHTGDGGYALQHRWL